MSAHSEQSRSYKNYTAKWTYGKLDDKEDKEDEKDIEDEKDEKDIEDYETPMKVYFYKDDKLLYTLKRNNYRTSHHDYLLLEYFEINGQVVHLFNLEHSVISIINTDNGSVIHNDRLFDVFIEHYEMFDDREYMYVGGWIWNPFPCRAIYHIPTFLATPNYEPTFIECWDHHSHDNGKLDLYGCATVGEFLEKKDDIMNQYYICKSTEKFNNHRTQEILLKVLLDSNDVVFTNDQAKDSLLRLLNNNQKVFYVRTFGMVSGDHLPRYDEALYKIINYFDGDNADEYKPSSSDTLTYLCPKIFFCGYTTRLPLEFADLRFDIHGESEDGIINLSIYYKQTFTWNGKAPNAGDCKRYDVDVTKPCSISIE